jgi:hypothetical protein
MTHYGAAVMQAFMPEIWIAGIGLRRFQALRPVKYFTELDVKFQRARMPKIYGFGF